MKNSTPTDKMRRRFFELVLDLGLGIQQQIEVMLQEYDLTFTQSMLLFRLYGKDDLQFKDLVNCQHTSKGAVSQIISVLQEKGLVLKEQSDSDKRNWYIRLSPEGKSILNKINLQRSQEMQFMYEGVGQTALQDIINNLEIINQNLNGKYNQ